MKVRHLLLKIGGICLLLLGIVNIIMGIVMAVRANAELSTFGALVEGIGAEGASALGAAYGGRVAGITMVITLIGSALYILTGLLGFTGKSLTACKVLGIIILIFSVIGFISSLGTIGNIGDIVTSIRFGLSVDPLEITSIISSILNIVSLVVALIYVIGAFKSVKE